MWIELSRRIFPTLRSYNFSTLDLIFHLKYFFLSSRYAQKSGSAALLILRLDVAPLKGNWSRIKRTIIHVLSHSVYRVPSKLMASDRSCSLAKSAIPVKFSRFESIVQSLQSRVRLPLFDPATSSREGNFVVFFRFRRQMGRVINSATACNRKSAFFDRPVKSPSSGDGAHNRERNCRHSQVVIFPPRQYIHYLPTWYFVPNCVVCATFAASF